jgi:hypothetical protein
MQREWGMVQDALQYDPSWSKRNVQRVQAAYRPSTSHERASGDLTPHQWLVSASFPSLWTCDLTMTLPNCGRPDSEQQIPGHDPRKHLLDERACARCSARPGSEMPSGVGCTTVSGQAVCDVIWDDDLERLMRALQAGGFKAKLVLLAPQQRPRMPPMLPKSPPVRCLARGIVVMGLSWIWRG